MFGRAYPGRFLAGSILAALIPGVFVAGVESARGHCRFLLQADRLGGPDGVDFSPVSPVYGDLAHPHYGNAEGSYRPVIRPRLETVCAENNTAVLHQGLEQVATADKPDF
jgi:hypothetical protein